MTDEVAIRVDSVRKDFYLPTDRHSSIKDVFIHPFKNKKSSKEAETQHALKEISFDVKKGEFFGIVGRNGSGKSTLLKLIAGIYQPTKGGITVDGRLVPFIELGVGFNPDLSGKENVYLNGALMGFSDHEVDQKYDEIVEFAELERFMNQKLNNYSSGMQVRLAFSVATILAQSDVLLIDEVLAVGDADFQSKCFSYFRKLKKNKKTVVFVSHDMSAVKEYCDKAILIEGGEIVAVGNTEDVAAKYTKLFDKDIKVEEDSPEGRWGDGILTATDITLEPRLISEKNSGKPVVIKVSVEASGQSGEWVAGFSIRDESGFVVAGTNSDLVDNKLKPMKKGEKKHLTWTIPDIFANGKYSVTITIDGEDQTIVHDRIAAACNFVVRDKAPIPYKVLPNMGLEVKG